MVNHHSCFPDLFQNQDNHTCFSQLYASTVNLIAIQCHHHISYSSRGGAALLKVKTILPRCQMRDRPGKFFQLDKIRHYIPPSAGCFFFPESFSYLFSATMNFTVLWLHIPKILCQLHYSLCTVQCTLCRPLYPLVKSETGLPPKDLYFTLRQRQLPQIKRDQRSFFALVCYFLLYDKWEDL